MVRRRRSRVEWQLLVAEFERSALTAEAFAQRYELAVSTLRWWRSRLRREDSAGLRHEEESLVPFVRVAVAQPMATADAGRSGPRLELPGGVLLHFDGASEPEFVAAVVASTSIRLESGGARC